MRARIELELADREVYGKNKMRQELDEYLCKVYPKMMVNRNKDMKETCMCWGFEVGDGWYKLIYELILNVRFNDEAKGKWITKVTQCKEKFGGLRFYVTGTSDKNWDLIREAEKKSYGVCEVTGSEVEVGVWNAGWVRTICKKEALSKFAKMSDANELNGKTFDELWKPREASVTIETPKKKRK